MVLDDITQEEVNTLLKEGKAPKYLTTTLPDGKEVPLIVVCKARIPESVRADNVKRNIQRPVQRYMNLPYLMRQRADPIALVGGGPSVAKYLDKIREFKAVMACGSAHDYLVTNGITPTYALATDPAEETINYYQHRSEKTMYLLASQCNPNMYEWLEDHAVVMWHFRGQIDDETVFQGEPQISWGCMVGVNAVQMALLLGYQHQHYFGYDCCVGARSHAYDLPEWENKEINEARTIATITSETGEQSQFCTTTALITQAAQILEVYKSEDGMYLKGYVYGNGMFANIIRQSPPTMANWLVAVDAHAAQ